MKVTELPKIVTAIQDVPFTLACYHCDAGDHIRSHEQAAQEGWTRIEYNDGAGWNFLGVCPECREEHQ